MKYFKPSEIKYYEKLEPKLLCALDNFRELVRTPVYISPVEGATFRIDNTNSQHCLGKAIDIFPTCSLWYALLAAIEIPEIKGIGLYPHWRYKNLTYGMHLDIRQSLDKVLWWRNKDKEYTTIHSLQQLREMIDEYT